MSKVVKIAQALRKELVSASLKSGDSAPSIRSIAETYSVSMVTASRVLNQLVSDDFLYRIPNRGTYVKYDPPKTLHIGYVGDIPTQSPYDDVLRNCAFSRMQSFLTKESITPRYVSYAELCQSAESLAGLDGIVIVASHVEARTLSNLCRYQGKIVVVGGMEVNDEISCSAVIPDWIPAFRDAFNPVRLSHFHRVFLVGAGHANALYLEKVMRRYLLRIGGSKLAVQGMTIKACNYDAAIRAFQCFQELKGQIGKDDLIISFSDYLSLGIREAFHDAEFPPSLVSFDNMEAYQNEGRGGGLSSIDWRFTDSYVEGFRLLLRMLKEHDWRNYIVKLPCRYEARAISTNDRPRSGAEEA